ncbi:uncharacterized protein LOC132719569 isoform X2 [Ruditapes philippinarum]|uniref:uncharacterized protein LOC132719569 isoform X2 n=1 Tax=Ruditapes philippinarum TaxID=129788 RepID=UPI00295A83A2|nr:uncharacterized protein LOC132719569 isoform X2 [Ruditapes philippinarum]
MDLRICMIWICINAWSFVNSLKEETGIDIGYSCTHDAECTTGNGGEYSKCNKDLNICICTINHLDSDQYVNVCRQQTLYTKPEMCTIECSPKGTKIWKKNEDWFGEITVKFASLILDKKTSVCYDPRRALDSVPDEFEIRESTIPNAGSGIFTKTYIEQDTMFGPYKGAFDPDTDSASESGYSWKIAYRQGEGRRDVEWVDAKDIYLSNWLRYSNSPISPEAENIIALQYQGEMYYMAFKSIQPGTELLVWYGDEYGDFLEIEKYESPNYYHANAGYAGGWCEEEEESLPCMNDKNTFCADNICLCVPGSHLRAGRCALDETLDGICVGVDGSTCKKDRNAECQRGVCVCKNNTTPADGVCRSDEMYGGRCAAKSGQPCLKGNNTECVRGFCRCIYGASAIGNVCVLDETYHGRCSGDHGDTCDLDDNAECWNKLCICKNNASVINGKCEIDETLGGKCFSEDGISCNDDKLAVCMKGVCVCKNGTTNVDGECITDGSFQGQCIEGNCSDKNLVCESNICV